MRRRPIGLAACSLATFVSASAAVLTTSPAHADEGQWTPAQIAAVQPAFAERGLELSAAELWNDEDGGLMRAIVNLSGCSAGFVSSRGLVATNHHCAYGAIQAQSSPEHDYLTDGFLAPSPAEELEAKGKTVKVLVAIEDVTPRLHQVVSAHEDPVERQRAVDRAGKEIVAECEATHPGHSCDLASFYRGTTFSLMRYLELLDVRLVLAPPSSVGNYGGEVDNWMWPRHSGDFTILRAYVGPDGKPAPFSPDNVPYEPPRWLEVSPTGVAPGDFVAVLGYPGHTDRYLSLPEVEREVDQFLPARVDLYRKWMDVYEAAGATDPAAKIKVAARLRSLANREKNARGMLAGISAIGLLEQRRSEAAELAAWAARRDGDRHERALQRMQAIADERRDAFPAGFLIDNAQNAGVAMDVAVDLVRWSKERTKPDVERAEHYMDRRRDRVWSDIERGIRDFDPRVDQATLELWVERIGALPEAQRFTTLEPTAIAAALRGTAILQTERARALFEEADWESLQRSTDPLIVWAREIVDAIEAREQQELRWDGEMLVIGPPYFEMVEAVRGGSIYPDANGTLRMSGAVVEGYAPRDGLRATPQTTVAGQVAKRTGVEPFDLPATVVEAASRAPSTFWADPALGDVPVCFLSNADTTGGNSGSPVVDGQGRWVGLNFDRVWENIAGDFGWRPDRSRNIVVDIRYLLWTMDEVFDASALLEELGVARYRDAPPRPRRPTAPAGDIEPVQSAAVVEDPVSPSPSTGSSGCACSSGTAPTPLPGAAWAWLSLGLLRRRRRR